MLNIWDSRGKPLERLRTRHCANIFDAHFKPDEEGLVASCAADGGVCLTPTFAGQGSHSSSSSASSSRIVWTARSSMALKLSFRPRDPEVLLSSFGDGSVRIFDLRATRPLVASLPIVPDQSRAMVVAEFSPCGQLIGTGADDAVRIVDIRQPGDATRGLQATRMLRLKSQQRRPCGVSGISWGGAGRMLLANYMAGDIVLFDTVEASRRLLHRPIAAPSAPSSESSQGASPAVAGDLLEDLSIEADDADSPERQRFRGRSNQRTFAKEVRFLLGDRYVASGGDCGHLFIWRTSDGMLLQRLQADGSVCNCVAPHPTLPIIAASGIDDTVKLFEVGGDTRPPLACRVSPGSRGRRLLDAVGAARGALGGGNTGTASAPGNPPCRPWAPMLRQFLARRLAAVRGLLLCSCRAGRREADLEMPVAA